MEKNKHKCIECKHSHFYYNEYVGTCWELNKVIRKNDIKNKCISFDNKRG